MRKMWSKGQIKTQISGASAEVVAALAGQDIVPKDVSASGSITGNSIIENMNGYTFEKQTDEELNTLFAGVCKNGNKITFVIYGKVTPDTIANNFIIGYFGIPRTLYDKLVSTSLESEYLCVDAKIVPFLSSLVTVGGKVDLIINLEKHNATAEKGTLRALIRNAGNLTNGATYIFRYEVTFLLSDNLAE